MSREAKLYDPSEPEDSINEEFVSLLPLALTRIREPIFKDQSAFGAKTITLLGSVVLNTNNIVGPSLVSIPLVFQLAGVIPTTLFFLLTYLMSSFSATMLCDAMQRIPGNRAFTSRYEFASTMGHFWGRKGEIVGQILVVLSLQASNIATIIVSAQVMDDFLLFLFGHTYAVRFIPPYKWLDVTQVTDKVFENEEWVLSLGYIVCTIICIPFGYLNLDENMWFQILTFFGMMITFTEFIVQFSTLEAYFDWAPLWGQDPLQGQAIVLGVIAFSFSFGTTIPSWVNEKKNSVGVNQSIWFSSTLSLFMQWVFGWFAAIVIQNPKQNSNILNVMSTQLKGRMGLATKICVYVFNIMTMMPAIPVNSILVRYNLVSSRILGPFLANVFAVLFPWVLSAFFYHGSGLSVVMNWSSILLQGFVNFVIPAVIYYKAIQVYPNPPKPKLPSFKINESSDIGGLVPPAPKFFETKHKDMESKDDTTSTEDSFWKEYMEGPPKSNEDSNEDSVDDVDVALVNAVPEWLRISPRTCSLLIIIPMTLLSIASIIMNIVFAILGIDLP